MKALIIAGGMGLRLKPLTDKLPKSLVKIKGRTILERVVDPLLANGINQLVIITGYRQAQLKKFIKQKYHQLRLAFVYSPFHENAKIRYIYPMWLARKELKDDILYIHGDVLVEPVLIKKLVNFSGSGALVHRRFASEKDFNAKIVRGLIKEIGVGVSGKQIGFCVPAYKLLKEDFALWLKVIGKFVRRKNLDCYAEEALNEVLDQIKLCPIYFDKKIGMEIDDFEDLRKAEKLLS